MKNSAKLFRHASTRRPLHGEKPMTVAEVSVALLLLLFISSRLLEVFPFINIFFFLFFRLSCLIPLFNLVEWWVWNSVRCGCTFLAIHSLNLAQLAAVQTLLYSALQLTTTTLMFYIFSVKKKKKFSCWTSEVYILETGIVT